ncbi:MAG: hypothetical protein V3S41_03405 [Spirochaetia bacterium]
MAGEERGEPQVLVPYPGPDGSGEVQDIFVYLRPETNGVLVESTLLRVIDECRKSRSDIKLIYLANIPGDFILRHHIVERHYAQKFYFAVHGKRAFTRSMRERVEAYFGVSWDDATVIGGFEALNVLHKTPEQLHSTWVPAGDHLVVDGQSIKRTEGIFIVNYDIPAILAKNSRSTDIAVMLFRCTDYGLFDEAVDLMHEALVQKGILGKEVPASRAFHYSKGPFEQLLDAVDYLYASGSDPVPLESLSFVQYAESRGFTLRDLLGVVRNPICLFDDDGGELREDNIFIRTVNDSYAESIDKLGHLRAQHWTRRY